MVQVQIKTFFQMHLSTHNLIKQIRDSKLPISHLQSANYQHYQGTQVSSKLLLCMWGAGFKHLFGPYFRSPFQHQAS